MTPVHHVSRYIVHGPRLEDLTDLLYWDGIVYPVTQALVRPQSLESGYVGYPVREVIPEEKIAALREAGLIKIPGALLLERPDGDDQPIKIESPFEFGQELGAIFADTFVNVLDLPADSVGTARWLGDLDRSAHRVAGELRKRGHRAVGKCNADTVTRVVTSGWSPVLSIRLHGMPSFAIDTAPIEDVIAFLSDDETRRLRADCFDWVRCLAEVESRDSRNLAELVVSKTTNYALWLARLGLTANDGVKEVLLRVDEGIDQMQDVQVANVQISRRGLARAPDELPDGTEILAVSHCERDWRRWFPGLTA